MKNLSVLNIYNEAIQPNVTFRGDKGFNPINLEDVKRLGVVLEFCESNSITVGKELTSYGIYLKFNFLLSEIPNWTEKARKKSNIFKVDEKSPHLLKVEDVLVNLSNLLKS